MERRAFLESLGLGAAFVLTATCLHSCSTSSSTNGITPTPGGTDITLDLSQSANAALKTNGGYIVTNGVVVARDTSGNYVAATQTCSHQGNQAVYYDASSNSYKCTVHGAQFSLAGTGLNANGSGGLTIFKATLSGNSLHITG